MILNIHALNNRFIFDYHSSWKEKTYLNMMYTGLSLWTSFKKIASKRCLSDASSRSANVRRGPQTSNASASDGHPDARQP
jgi:hypothetical protein